MNRAQRREAERQKARLPSWLPPSKEERVKRLMQQGISPEDLQREYDSGFDEGFRAAAKPMVRMMYAAAILVLHDLFGFGPTRCLRYLRALEDKLIWTLTTADAAEEVLEKMGLEIDFSEPFNRVYEKEGFHGRKSACAEHQ